MVIHWYNYIATALLRYYSNRMETHQYLSCIVLNLASHSKKACVVAVKKKMIPVSTVKLPNFLFMHCVFECYLKMLATYS